MVKRRSPTGGPHKEAQEAEDLLAQALSRPGVRELMAVYGKCERATRAFEGYRRVLAPKNIISSSNASMPTVQRGK